MSRKKRISTPVTKCFSDRLDDLIEASGKTQSEIAKETGISESSITAWKTDTQTATIDGIFTLAQYFNVSTDYLLGLTNVKTLDCTVMSICNYTGLSDKAIEVLKNLDCDEQFAVSALITSYSFNSYISCIVMSALLKNREISHWLTNCNFGTPQFSDSKLKINQERINKLFVNTILNGPEVANDKIADSHHNSMFNEAAFSLATELGFTSLPEGVMPPTYFVQPDLN